MIIAAAIAALATLYLSWRRPVWGAYGVLALLPAYQVRFAVAGVPSTLLEVVAIAAFLGASVHWAQKKSPFPHLSRRGIGAALLWLAIGGLGVAVAQDTYIALGLYRAYVVEPLLTLPLWLAVWQSEADRRGALGVLSAQLILAASVAILQQAHIISSPAPWIHEAPPRVVGFFAYPNALALYAAPLAALLGATALTILPFRRWERPLWIIGALSGVLACALAVSRGALLALGIATVILGAWSSRKRWWWFVCGLVLAVLIILPMTRGKIIDVVQLRDTSTDVRTVLWRGTWRLIADRPLMGAGLGAFPTLYPYYKDDQHVELLQYPHNLVLNAWVELGAAGALFTIGTVFWLSFALFRRLRAHDAWAVGALAAWIVVVVHGLVDVPYFKNDLAMLTIFLLVIAVTKTTPAEHKIPSA